MLKQFKDFSLFSELGDIIQRLEDKVYSEKSHQPSIIHLDKNDNLKGLQHLDTLYQSILKKLCLQITYRSFRAREASIITFHPYILKQFNNRWFLVGRMFNNPTIQVLALDRIVAIDFDLKTEYKVDNFDGDKYFHHTIGVTVLTDLQLASIILKFDQSNAPYVLTKPLHHSQKLVEKFADGSITIELYVHLNYELERLILGFGETVEVLAPRNLRGKIKKKLRLALGQYE
jgi:predicted DNA-binding transcriptional regulator YafY